LLENQEAIARITPTPATVIAVMVYPSNCETKTVALKATKTGEVASPETKHSNYYLIYSKDPVINLIYIN